MIFYVIFKIHIYHISKYILIKCHETNHRIYCNSCVIIPLKLAGLAFEELEVFPAERRPFFKKGDSMGYLRNGEMK